VANELGFGQQEHPHHLCVLPVVNAWQVAMSESGQEVLRRREDFQSRAKECRANAEMFRNEDARQAMLRAADVYEKTAAQTVAAIQ
jgi:hypothetical protein